jgi:hypothetical protein
MSAAGTSRTFHFGAVWLLFLGMIALLLFN